MPTTATAARMVKPKPMPSDARFVKAMAELRRDFLKARQEAHLRNEQRLRQIAAALETDLFPFVEPLGLAELGGTARGGSSRRTSGLPGLAA
jgi:hypothetical protein